MSDNLNAQIEYCPENAGEYTSGDDREKIVFRYDSLI